jgi:F420-dependent oxidoreductase-like protein
VKLGLQIPDFTWPSGPARLGPELASFTRTADDAGFAYISVMDHFWQIGMVGPPEHGMLEAYTTLGFIAANTSRATVHTLVTGVVYRPPGLLAKIVTTLDVLSGGRAMLGIGAAWNSDEAHGLGFPFPPIAERFERLEETIQICLQMWGDDNGPYRGKHYQLDRTLNSPQPLSKPHPPIMIGGSGERKTLRLVARYAQACNLYRDLPQARDSARTLRDRGPRLRRDRQDLHPPDGCGRERRKDGRAHRPARRPGRRGHPGGDRFCPGRIADAVGGNHRQ